MPVTTAVSSRDGTQSQSGGGGGVSTSCLSIIKHLLPIPFFFLLGYNIQAGFDMESGISTSSSIEKAMQGFLSTTTTNFRAADAVIFKNLKRNQRIIQDIIL